MWERFTLNLMCSRDVSRIALSVYTEGRPVDSLVSCVNLPLGLFKYFIIPFRVNYFFFFEQPGTFIMPEKLRMKNRLSMTVCVCVCGLRIFRESAIKATSFWLYFEYMESLCFILWTYIQAHANAMHKLIADTLTVVHVNA